MTHVKREDNDLGYTGIIVDSLTRKLLNANLKTGEIMSDNTSNMQVYDSIEDYSVKTGKRFRMTKEQKARNLSREEAFIEFNTRAVVANPTPPTNTNEVQQ
jgi:hypothetical protein